MILCGTLTEINIKKSETIDPCILMCDKTFQISGENMEYFINCTERTPNMKLEPTSYHSKNKSLINEITNELEKIFLNVVLLEERYNKQN